MNNFKQFLRTARNVYIQSAKAHKVAQKLKGKHKMRAWQIHSYGDLGELQLSEPRIPYLTNPADLLVEVQAASLNPIDLAMINGYGKTLLNVMRSNDLEFPLTLGRDFSGVVVDKGHEVGRDIKIGDKVYGIVPVEKQGSHADFVLCNKAHVLTLPQHLAPVDAASILYVAMTAWSALFITGGLLMSDMQSTKVLVLGASGGVGTAAVQILKSQKAQVFAACSADAIPLVNSLGADQVFDYGSSNYTHTVQQAAEYDIIFDCANVGFEKIPETWNYKSFVSLNSPVLQNTDKYGLLGGTALSLNSILCANIRKIREGKIIKWAYFWPSQQGLQFIDKLVKTNKLKPIVHKVFKFEELPKAFESLKAGHTRGKLVIDFI